MQYLKKQVSQLHLSCFVKRTVQFSQFLGAQTAQNRFSAKDKAYQQDYLCLPSLSETLNNEMHYLSSFTGLMKDIRMWSKMAEGKGPKPPLFKYHNFYCSATYLKRQPSKGEGTKNASIRLYTYLQTKEKDVCESLGKRGGGG